MDIDAKMVMALRQKTGAPMKDCRQALIEAQGDEAKAIEVLRKKGLKAGEGLAGRAASEGLVCSYVHHNGRIGVLVELGCETDFVARNEEFQKFGRDVCLHIAAMRPKFLDKESIAADFLADERRIFTEQTQEQMKGRPDDVIQKAIEGRVQKMFAEVCLLEQPWVHDGNLSVAAALKALAGKIGENLAIRRFHRMELGL
ncbi:MAG: translation elongation factor Ts [Planctomycetota bacterium]